MTVREYATFKRGYYDGITGLPCRSEGEHYARGWRYGRNTRKNGLR
jgi:hypothetical protein